MTQKRIFTLLAITLGFGAGLFVMFQNRPPTPAELLKAEQEVYAALLQDQKNAYSDPTDTLQIIEYTNSGELRGNTPLDSAGYHLDFDPQEFPDLNRKTWIDFQEKNQISYPIKEYFPASAEVLLVDPTNGEQLYWWVSFSRIGFDPSLTQALVLVGDCRGEACFDSTSESMYSMGDYIFLQKENGEWIVKDWQDAWFIEAPSP